MKNSPIILIVDDDSDLLDMYQEVIVVEGVTTLSVNSGREALEYCQKNPNVQVVISDAHMGEMSGMELLKGLKGQYETLPVFYLLTGAFDIPEEEIIKEGGRGLILKPFDLDEILDFKSFASQ